MRLSASRGLAAALLALVLAPPAASAQVHDFGVRCVTGSFRACASVQAWNELDPVTGEYDLYVAIANVQGRPGYTHLVRSGIGWFMINDLTLFNYTTNPLFDSGNLEQDVHERIDNISSQALPGDYLTWQNTGGLWDTGAVPYAESEYLIWGCYVPGPGDANFYWGGASTCGAPLVYRFRLGFGAGLALTGTSTIGLAFDTYDNAGTVSSASCGIGRDHSSTMPCGTVTPEPVTMLLLATGLAGVGGAGAVRRRRRDGDDTPDDAAPTI